MTINELIAKMNQCVSENDNYNLEDILYELYDELEPLHFTYVTTINRNEYRWYILAENVYSVSIDGKKYYIGVWEVETLKSESMSVSDCECKLYFYEMEEYTTVSYQRKGE